MIQKEKINIIQIEGLSKSFKKQEVIKNLNLTFNENDRIALIGQNGAGKTTLIRCMLGQYNFEGKMEILNMNPRIDRKNILQHIGFVPQMPPPLKLTVRELIYFFEKLTGTDANTFIRLSHEMGLSVEDNFSKPFFKLSGGMKQKLLISFALGRKPRILLLDEPSANLDPQARKILFDHLKDFAPKTLMILSSHRMDEIAGIVNRVIEMDLGVVVLDKNLN
ncbi:MAG: ABC transporter ATP-binding protein [Bacteroidales bacterium]|nr:ABC transporter ATP-binding protein [Bacteroidales bacterium]